MSRKTEEVRQVTDEIKKQIYEDEQKFNEQIKKPNSFNILKEIRLHIKYLENKLIELKNLE